MEKKKQVWLPVMIVLAVIIIVFAVLSVVITVSTNTSGGNSASGEESVEESTEDLGNSTYVQKALEDYSVQSDVQPAAEDVRAMDNPDGYILPSSDAITVTSADLTGLTAQELTYARNEIYARHGKVFESTELNDYFAGKTWYIANAAFDDATLTELEAANAGFISQYQTENSLEYTPQ